MTASTVAMMLVTVATSTLALVFMIVTASTVAMVLYVVIETIFYKVMMESIKVIMLVISLSIAFSAVSFDSRFPSQNKTSLLDLRICI
ncbi:hypothetical protein [Ureibacillus aquaedulcis]|uniref:Uncharacterized protein n=1 Tax=Ureibacillus aquaedulcis TaxID=3058421 RepID=A0ABT8GN12_9BACL|nr:hypothetical protein [Ureibacillus sp. BA0131]MDN4492803.1 hypothetical protein [Ureibacillus sp. BA0131]